MIKFLYIFLICVNFSLEIDICPYTNNGTVDYFKEIFLGQCYYYINVLNRDKCEIINSNFNCTNIWMEFSKVVLNKQPCSISSNDYKNYLDSTSHSYDTDKSIFWSGTNFMAHQISRLMNYWTVEDTLGQCVSYDNPFWNAVSINFAKKATKEILVVLNGTRVDGALKNSSTFYRFEMPNLNFTLIKKVKVILLHLPDKPKFETCKKPKTLDSLRKLVEGNNAIYECEDENFYFNSLLCIQNLQSQECRRNFPFINKSIRVENQSSILGITFILTFFIKLFI
ncbi:unnamed protein product [Brachionus calyciflorus]|uniref:ADP-ribosyl cyclase/cyclic ADP-ribose hydrolase n=1 Tax=Brachionus calyciflorus TaxID=104777 RepID=A0A813TXK9_9BILA|nr:unnamed protein product [Brachionus calyciflorus]